MSNGSKMIRISRQTIPVHTFNTVVVGTGAAGFNAADRLHGYGQTDLAIVTEHRLAGTSRNTGSDKQTYYKLTLSGDEPDSVREMAKTLFSGQCVDGDHALTEAALSAPCFLRLADLGVPFPTNRYGEYIGYKTDHDPRRRATSVGPLTSKSMTEALERSVLAKGIPIFDHCQVISILTDAGQVVGILCLDLAETAAAADTAMASEAAGAIENAEIADAADVAEAADVADAADTGPGRYRLFLARNVVLATGGPAGMYADSVYPFGHYGATGVAFQAGAVGKNLTEWQYGLASVKPRWNVSGTYMQVLPRFISTDRDGGDAREFLGDFFQNRGELLSRVFLKGYEWPFDVQKVASGSSIIDILVYIECALKNRRVFLDFRDNPFSEPVDYSGLATEARVYLEKAGALFGTPIERLQHMNSPAVDFYRSRGVDLATEPLEIALSAQHNNGGLSVDLWWQTSISGLFAVGEAAASHGVYRPGGSALNAGQVGSTRAAQYIRYQREGDAGELPDTCLQQITHAIDRAARAWQGTNPPVGALESTSQTTAGSTVDRLWQEAQVRMSRSGAAIRSVDLIQEALRESRAVLEQFERIVKVTHISQLAKFYRLNDVLTCQCVYLEAMIDYVNNGGKSRGSALYHDAKGQYPHAQLPELFRYSLDDGSRGNLVQEVTYADGACRFNWRPVRPIPEDDDFFENVWRQYRENRNIY